MERFVPPQLQRSGQLTGGHWVSVLPAASGRDRCEAEPQMFGCFIIAVNADVYVVEEVF